MRTFVCSIFGHDWQTFHEEMVVKARPDDIYPTYVQFDKCRKCSHVRAMAVNPDNTLTDLSIPDALRNERITSTENLATA